MTFLAWREEQNLSNIESTSSFDSTPLWPGQKEILTAAEGWVVQRSLRASVSSLSPVLFGAHLSSRRRALWQSVSTQSAVTLGSERA